MVTLNQEGLDDMEKREGKNILSCPKCGRTLLTGRGCFEIEVICGKCNREIVLNMYHEVKKESQMGDDIGKKASRIKNLKQSEAV